MSKIHFGQQFAPSNIAWRIAYSSNSRDTGISPPSFFRRLTFSKLPPAILFKNGKSGIGLSEEKSEHYCFALAMV
jgi:hypothetical protein